MSDTSMELDPEVFSVLGLEHLNLEHRKALQAAFESALEDAVSQALENALSDEDAEEFERLLDEVDDENAFGVMTAWLEERGIDFPKLLADAYKETARSLGQEADRVADTAGILLSHQPDFASLDRLATSWLATI